MGGSFGVLICRLTPRIVISVVVSYYLAKTAILSWRCFVKQDEKEEEAFVFDGILGEEDNSRYINRREVNPLHIIFSIFLFFILSLITVI